MAVLNLVSMGIGGVYFLLLSSTYPQLATSRSVSSVSNTGLLDFKLEKERPQYQAQVQAQDGNENRMQTAIKKVVQQLLEPLAAHYGTAYSVAYYDVENPEKSFEVAAGMVQKQKQKQGQGQGRQEQVSSNSNSNIGSTSSTSTSTNRPANIKDLFPQGQITQVLTAAQILNLAKLHEDEEKSMSIYSKQEQKQNFLNQKVAPIVDPVIKEIFLIQHPETELKNVSPVSLQTLFGQNASQITIQDLLMHRSDIADYNDIISDSDGTTAVVGHADYYNENDYIMTTMSTNNENGTKFGQPQYFLNSLRSRAYLNPHKVFTPADLLKLASEKQMLKNNSIEEHVPYNLPVQSFRVGNPKYQQFSNTNYLLLGLILKAKQQKDFYQQPKNIQAFDHLGFASWDSVDQLAYMPDYFVEDVCVDREGFVDIYFGGQYQHGKKGDGESEKQKSMSYYNKDLFFYDQTGLGNAVFQDQDWESQYEAAYQPQEKQTQDIVGQLAGWTAANMVSTTKVAARLAGDFLSGSGKMIDADVSRDLVYGSLGYQGQGQCQTTQSQNDEVQLSNDQRYEGQAEAKLKQDALDLQQQKFSDYLGEVQYQELIHATYGDEGLKQLKAQYQLLDSDASRNRLLQSDQDQVLYEEYLSSGDNRIYSEWKAQRLKEKYKNADTALSQAQASAQSTTSRRKLQEDELYQEYLSSGDNRIYSEWKQQRLLEKYQSAHSNSSLLSQASSSRQLQEDQLYQEYLSSGDNRIYSEWKQQRLIEKYNALRNTNKKNNSSSSPSLNLNAKSKIQRNRKLKLELQMDTNNKCQNYQPFGLAIANTTMLFPEVFNNPKYPINYIYPAYQPQPSKQYSKPYHFYQNSVGMVSSTFGSQSAVIYFPNEWLNFSLAINTNVELEMEQFPNQHITDALTRLLPAVQVYRWYSNTDSESNQNQNDVEDQLYEHEVTADQIMYLVSKLNKTDLELHLDVDRHFSRVNLSNVSQYLAELLEYGARQKMDIEDYDFVFQEALANVDGAHADEI